MNQKEAIAVIKARGWRLKSKTQQDVFDNTPTRMWYVLDEEGNVVVKPRYSKGLAIDWAIVMITGDWEKRTLLRIVEHENMWGDK